MAKSKNKILKDNAKYFLETQDKKEKKWERTPTREEVRDAGFRIDLAKHPVIISHENDKLVPIKQLYEKYKAEEAKELLKDALVKK
jgi:hypothetical protein